MNERIKLLAEQATTIEYGADGGFDCVTFDKEKFAELIVAECCKEISYASVGHEDSVFAYAYIDHLRNTFGVE